MRRRLAWVQQVFIIFGQLLALDPRRIVRSCDQVVVEIGPGAAGVFEAVRINRRELRLR